MNKLYSSKHFIFLTCGSSCLGFTSSSLAVSRFVLKNLTGFRDITWKQVILFLKYLSRYLTVGAFYLLRVAVGCCRRGVRQIDNAVILPAAATCGRRY